MRVHALTPRGLVPVNTLRQADASRIFMPLSHDTMALRHTIEVLASPGSSAGLAFFREPLRSDETLIAEVPPTIQPALFCHRHQTDQLMVLRGSIDLIVLQNRQLRCITLREDEATWVRIPPCIPHGAINRGRTAAVVVNAVLRHRPSDGKDYRARPLPPALAATWTAIRHGRDQHSARPIPTIVEGT